MKVKVGVVGDKASEQHAGSDAANAEIALWMEHGTRTVPERSFIRRTLRDNGVLAEFRILQASTWAAVFAGTMTSQAALEAQGKFMAEAIRRTITDVQLNPELAQSTVEAKGSDKTLVDTHQLADAVGFEIVK